MECFPESTLGFDTGPVTMQAGPFQLMYGKLGLGSHALEYQQAQSLLHGFHTHSVDGSAEPYGSQTVGCHVETLRPTDGFVLTTSHIESKVHDVPFLGDIFLAFQT